MFKKLISFCIMMVVSCNSISEHIDLINNTDSDTITRNEVRQLFLLKKKRLSDGTLTTLIQMNQKSFAHRNFVRDVLKLSIEDYNKIIAISNNSGFSGNIITVRSEDEMVQKVSSVANSIGYINKDYLLINSLVDNVKVYKIIE